MEKYHGKHREDEVGSLRWSDEDCLTSERVSKMISEQIAAKNGYYTIPDYGE